MYIFITKKLKDDIHRIPPNFLQILRGRKNVTFYNQVRSGFFTRVRTGSSFFLEGRIRSFLEGRIRIFLEGRIQIFLEGRFLIRSIHSGSRYLVLTWYLHLMVTQNMLRTCEGKQDLSEINFEFVTLDLSKSLEQIKLPISLHTCAPISELPS